MRTLSYFGGAWVDWFATAMLLLTTIVSYANEAYGTAVVAGLCAGFVGGISASKAIIQSRDRRS